MTTDWSLGKNQESQSNNQLWNIIGLSIYRDLNNATELNNLREDMKNDIWSPKLLFANALGERLTTVDEATVARAVKNAIPLEENLFNAVEEYQYLGQNVSIAIRRKYYQEMSCLFSLYKYPFDTQVRLAINHHFNLRKIVYTTFSAL